MSNVKQAVNQFSPIIHWIGNMVGILAVYAAGVILAVFTPWNNIMGWFGVLLVIYTWHSGMWWYNEWMIRDKEVKKLDIADARALEDWTSDERNELVRKIRRRPSGVLRSYIMYFVPHLIWIGIWYSMFGSFSPIVSY